MSEGTRTLKGYAGRVWIDDSDELLGTLPPTATAAEGILAWSIGFSDAFRAPSTSSSSTSATEDELLGLGGAIVGPSASQGRSLGLRSRPIIINSNTVLERDPTPSAPIFIIILSATQEVIPSSDSVSSSRTMPFQDTFGVVNNPFEIDLLKPLAPSSF